MIRPLFDNILIKHRDGRTHTDAGLTLPDSMKPAVVEADVIAVSEAGDLEMTARIADTANLADLKALANAIRSIRQGDVVLVHRLDGDLIGRYGGYDDLRVIKERQVLAIVVSAKTT